MREVVLAVAAKGIFQPLWSDRLLEEWARAAARHGAEQETYARGEIALLRARWAKSIVQPAPGIEARLWLPDSFGFRLFHGMSVEGQDIVYFILTSF